MRLLHDGRDSEMCKECCTDGTLASLMLMPELS